MKWWGATSQKKRRECDVIERVQSPERPVFSSRLFCLMRGINLSKLLKISRAWYFHIFHNKDNVILTFKVVIKNKKVIQLLWGLPMWRKVKVYLPILGDVGSIPGSGRSLGERNGNPLQYSCLGNPMDVRAWWAIVRWITESQHNLVTQQQQHNSYNDEHLVGAWEIITGRGAMKKAAGKIILFKLCIFLTEKKKLQICN